MVPAGGRGRIFTDVKETTLVDMVITNNVIKFRQIWDRVLRDNATFANVTTVSTTTIARVLEKNKVWMRQLYKVKGKEWRTCQTTPLSTYSDKMFVQ